MPRWVLRLILVKLIETRPQVSFLPFVEDTGSSKPTYQSSLEKDLTIHKERAAKQQANPTSTERSIAA